MDVGCFPSLRSPPSFKKKQNKPKRTAMHLSMPRTSPPGTGKQRDMAGLRRKGYSISIGAKTPPHTHKKNPQKPTQTNRILEWLLTWICLVLFPPFSHTPSPHFYSSLFSIAPLDIFPTTQLRFSFPLFFGNIYIFVTLHLCCF